GRMDEIEHELLDVRSGWKRLGRCLRKGNSGAEEQHGEARRFHRLISQGDDRSLVPRCQRAATGSAEDIYTGLSLTYRPVTLAVISLAVDNSPSFAVARRT